MSLQIACLRRGIVTLVAFVWPFPTVHFQMFPQIACLKRCIVTLVAFVGLFSTVPFQMCPQNICTRGCIVTLVAFVWLFSTVDFQMCPQSACMGRCIVTMVAFMWLYKSRRARISGHLGKIARMTPGFLWFFPDSKIMLWTCPKWKKTTTSQNFCFARILPGFLQKWAQMKN